MTSKLIIGLLCLALLLTIMLKDCTGPPTFNPVNVDSISGRHALAIDSMTVVQIGIERELQVAKQVIRSDSQAIARANATLSASTKKVRALLIANSELKAANDTLGMLDNCGQLVEENYLLLAKVDSLVHLIPQYQQSIDDLVLMYEQGLEAANNKAIELTRYNDALRGALEACNARGIQLSQQNKRALRKAQRGGLLTGVAAGAVLTIILNGILK